MCVSMVLTCMRVYKCTCIHVGVVYVRVCTSVFMCTCVYVLLLCAFHLYERPELRLQNTRTRSGFVFAECRYTDNLKTDS